MRQIIFSFSRRVIGIALFRHMRSNYCFQQKCYYMSQFIIFKQIYKVESMFPISCIEQFPQNQILREDDHRLKISSYFEVSSKNFAFGYYNHGSKALKQKYKIPKHLYRYFNKRNFLFSKFEQGIEIDEQSWYSVIPQDVSLYLKDRFKSKKITKIFQPFCGVGGIAIHLSDAFSQYIVNDIDKNKIQMLKNNLKVYNKDVNKIQFYNEDFLAIEPFQTDALIICPPWGGIDTEQYASQDLDSIMNPKLSDILEHAMKFSNQILLQMPKQTNLGNLIRVIHKVGLKPIFSIQKILTNDKCSQLFIYFGNENFVDLNSPQLYNLLYRDLQKQSKVDKKRIKCLLKSNSSQIMNEVYRSTHPNKITYFND